MQQKVFIAASQRTLHNIKVNPVLKKVISLVAIVLISLNHSQTLAQSDNLGLDHPTDLDEAYDPFSDYSEVEQDAEEEADINFFKNGRFLTLGLQLGYRGFTDGMSRAYTPNLLYGVQFSYFFDLNLAGALGFVLGDHPVAFNAMAGNGTIQETITGTVNIQQIDLNIKYYFNMQNVTRGLADLNPYMIFGVGHYIRTYNMDQSLSPNPDRIFGFKLGGGIEVPMLRKQAFLGIQALYHLVQFPDEGGTTIDLGDGVGGSAPAPVDPMINGDPYDISIILGVNF